MNAYIALIHKEPDSDFGVSFPDLPGCVTAGSTLDEARAVPSASTFEAIVAEPLNRDALAVLIDVPETAAVG